MDSVQTHRAAQAAQHQALEAERQRLVKLCQIARKALRWTDDAWEGIKRQHGEAESLTDMDVAELEAVLGHAKACGFKVTHARADGSRSRPLSQGAQARKLRAMWLELAGLGIVRDGAESALCSWVVNSRDPRVTTDLSILSPQQLHDGIERLKAWRTRELQRGELLCPQCGRHFRPTPKQAAAFPRLACDGHEPAVRYQWRRAK